MNTRSLTLCRWWSCDRDYRTSIELRRLELEEELTAALHLDDTPTEDSLP